MSRFHLSFVSGVVFFALLTITFACFRRPVKSRVDEILSVVTKALPSNSFEVYDFKVGWYNDLVESKFHLAYSDDTVALSTHTIPGVFEKSFKPFICEHGLGVANDSWPQFSEYYMKKVQHSLMKKLNLEVPDEDILYPHIMLGPSHPAILVQTAAHIAGAAFYYQRMDVINDPWPKDMKIYGVSLHPKYGGWFFMGPVIILRDVKFPGMKKKSPKDVLVNDTNIIKFLDLANGNWYSGNWRDQRWRNVIKVEKNYTQDHLEYSMTYGETRTEWVKKFYNDTCGEELKTNT